MKPGEPKYSGAKLSRPHGMELLGGPMDGDWIVLEPGKTDLVLHGSSDRGVVGRYRLEAQFMQDVGIWEPTE